MSQEQVVSKQIQIKRSDKTLADLSTEKLKYGEPILLTNNENKALVIGDSNENNSLENDYYIPIANRETANKGYMVKGVDYVTAGKKVDSTIGTNATAEGNNTTASGDASHAEGSDTIANHKSQHVFGEFNEADTSSQDASSRGNFVEIVGKGTAENDRSNARTLDWNGNEVLAGKLTVGAAPEDDMDVATKKFVLDNKPNASDLQGTLNVNNGGTGKTSWNARGVLYASDANTLANTGAGTAGYVLQSGGTNNNPSWINATNANTASTVVKRDASGNFSAGTITANLTGVASKATAANITTKTNAIATYSNTTGNFSYVQTKKGAAYAGPGTDSALTFGTLPLEVGGTGNASWTLYGLVYADHDSLGQVPTGTRGYVLQSMGNAAPSWINATNENTADTIVKRTSNGNFSAGVITASLSGNATTATTLKTARAIRTNLASTSSASFNGSADITPGVTGTLPVTNGGTGLTAAPSMLTNLGSTTAANVFIASPRPGVTGTLGIANGGTGKTALGGALATSMYRGISISTTATTPAAGCLHAVYTA